MSVTQQQQPGSNVAPQQQDASNVAPTTTTIDTNQQQGASVLGNLTQSAGNAGRMVAGQVQGQVDSVLKRLHFSEYKSAVLAEFFGSFILTVTASLAQTGSNQLAPIAIGFMYASLIFTYHYISGAHFNPAMTLGVWLSRDGPKNLVWHKAMLFWIFQLLGSTAAAFYCLLVHGTDFAVPTTPDTFYPGIFRVLVTEAVFTFMLVSVMLHVAHSKQKDNSFHGFAVGMMMMSALLANGGGVLNPAIATALIVVKCFTGSCIPVLHLWVFWTGELVGCIFAAIFYNVASATLEAQEEQDRQQLEQRAQQNAQDQFNSNPDFGAPSNNTNNTNQQQNDQNNNVSKPAQQQSSVRYGDAPQDVPSVARSENVADTPRASNPNYYNNTNNNNQQNQQRRSSSQPQQQQQQQHKRQFDDENNNNNYSNEMRNRESTAPPPSQQQQQQYNQQNEERYNNNNNNQYDQQQRQQQPDNSSNGNNNGQEEVSPLYQ